VTRFARAFVPAALLACALALAAPTRAPACACGCGVFEVGAPSAFPSAAGGMLSLEYDFMSQDQNWSGTSAAPAGTNEDKLIRTQFVTAHVEWMATRAWGVAAEAPYWDRTFHTTADDGGPLGFDHGAFGDVRVSALYTGFSDDFSTGVSAGLKLPTGDDTYGGFDRDTEIGTGSTDALLGLWHLGALDAQRRWTWFTSAQGQLPLSSSGGYRPGDELDAAAGLAAPGSRAGSVTLTPRLALLGTVRARDAGDAADPDNSGYRRLLASPGVDVRLPGLRAAFTADVPLLQSMNGHQLVAPVLFKFELGRAF